jgi:proton-dependent oligopeptide transporter, POT family
MTQRLEVGSGSSASSPDPSTPRSGPSGSKAATDKRTFIQRLFAHPRGLTYLSVAEAWERFSFSGMQTLLVLYLGRELLLPGHAEKVLGLGLFRTAISHLFGHPLSNAALASMIFGIYSGGVYLTPLLGGFIADRVLGRTRTIIMGSCFLIAGHFLMAFDISFLVALTFLMCGAGCFKTNIAAQVGDLYAPDDAARASGFQLYMIGISTAVIVAPLVCGTIGEKISFHWGFGVAGVGMVIGLAVYLSGLRFYPRALPPTPSDHQKPSRLERGDGLKLIVLLMTLPGLALISVGNEQMFNAYITWAAVHLDLSLSGQSMPVTWLISIDAVIAVLAMAGVVAFWQWRARKHRDPDEIIKLLVGAVICAVAPLILVVAGMREDLTGQKIGINWALLFHVINEIGIANVFPVSLALFSRVSPKSIGSVMIAVMYFNQFASNLLVGWLGSLMESMTARSFWLLHTALISVGFLILLLVAMFFGRVLAPRH